MEALVTLIKYSHNFNEKKVNFQLFSDQNKSPLLFDKTPTFLNTGNNDGFL